MVHGAGTGYLLQRRRGSGGVCVVSKGTTAVGVRSLIVLCCLRDGCEGTSCPHCKPHAANHAAYITSTPHSRAHMRGPDEDKSGGGGEVGEVRGPVAMYLLKRGGFGGWVGESQRGLPCSS